MVIVCWIVAVLALLVLVVCLLPLGIRAVFTEKTVTLTAYVGPVPIQVYPQRVKEKEEKEEKASAKKEQAAVPAKAKKKRTEHMPSLQELREAARVLWPPLRRALERTRRGIRVDPLMLSVTLGGARDPAETAQTYGWLHGAVWSGMPVLEQMLVIPDPGIHIGVDFDGEQTLLEGSVGLRTRVGTLLIAGASVAIPVLRWLSQMEKRKRDRKAASPESDGKRPAA